MNGVKIENLSHLAEICFPKENSQSPKFLRFHFVNGGSIVLNTDDVQQSQKEMMERHMISKPFVL